MNKVYFSSVKEARDRYFVEYRPPLHGYTFATLSITFLATGLQHEVVAVMEQEAVTWVKRYPIALMISSFDDAGDLIYLNDLKPESHLICFYDSTKTNIEFHWALLQNEQMPQDALDTDYILEIYKSFNRKTSTELKLEAEKHHRQMRLGTKIIVFWAVGLPALVLVIEFFIPQWLAALVLMYGLCKALVLWLKMTGRWRKTASEIAREAEDLQIRHHQYHCKKNPDGFLRLKQENFENESKAQIKNEVEAITLNEKSKKH